jgi:hypothetical protein
MVIGAKSAGAVLGETGVRQIAIKSAKETMTQKSEIRKTASRADRHFAWIVRNSVTVPGLLIAFLFLVDLRVTLEGKLQARIIRSVEVRNVGDKIGTGWGRARGPSGTCG